MQGMLISVDFSVRLSLGLNEWPAYFHKRTTNIFFDHTLDFEQDVQPWLDQLKNGIFNARTSTRHAPCPFDKQNLTNSAVFLLASVTTKFRQEIQQDVKLNATGLEVFDCILHRKLHAVLSLQCDLIAQLEKLDITQEPGECIPPFNLKVKELQ